MTESPGSARPWLWVDWDRHLRTHSLCQRLGVELLEICIPGPRLLRYLRAMVGDDAEDVASEAWLHIARDLPGFSGDSDGFRGWAATIARHRALDHLRRHTRRPPAIPVPAEDLAGLAAADDTASTAIDAITTTAAIRLISRLPPDQAEAVLLRAVLGLDATRAAAVLGKRPGAVRTAAHRGLRALARHLDQP